MRQFITGIAFLMIITGCAKDFDVDPKSVKPLYVIEGRISNLWGPYHIRVTKSSGLQEKPRDNYWERDSAEPVKDALVIITDDTGITDTLIPAPNESDRWHYMFDFAMVSHKIDSIYANEVNYFNHERGYYQTTKIKGLPGRTYRLRVEIGNEVFEASAYMPAVPELEHAEYRDTLVAPFPDVRPLPIAYFRDPPAEKNYYLLITHNLGSYRYDDNFGAVRGVKMNTLPYWVFDDKLLTGDLNIVPGRYIINDQLAPWESYISRPDIPVQLRLESLTKEAYDYFTILGKQVANNGTVYKPSPASPKGNVSGGALGLFYASHISDKVIHAW
jgi:hypothetical protein